MIACKNHHRENVLSAFCVFRVCERNALVWVWWDSGWGTQLAHIAESICAIGRETLKCMWVEACWDTETVCVCGCDLALLPDLCPNLPLFLPLSLFTIPSALTISSHGKINNASKHIKNISQALLPIKEEDAGDGGK